MNTPYTDSYDRAFLLDTMMGPNAMLGTLLPFLKPGGHIAVAVPGFIGEYSETHLPEVVKPFWTPEWYFYPLCWWKALWEKEPGAILTTVREMDTCQQAWDEFMQCEIAQEMMVPIMDAGAGAYFNMIQLVAQKR